MKKKQPLSRWPLTFITLSCPKSWITETTFNILVRFIVCIIFLVHFMISLVFVLSSGVILRGFIWSLLDLLLLVFWCWVTLKDEVQRMTAWKSALSQTTDATSRFSMPLSIFKNIGSKKNSETMVVNVVCGKASNLSLYLYIPPPNAISVTTMHRSVLVWICLKLCDY